MFPSVELREAVFVYLYVRHNKPIPKGKKPARRAPRLIVYNKTNEMITNKENGMRIIIYYYRWPVSESVCFLTVFIEIINTIIQ